MSGTGSRYHETYAAWQRDPEAFWAEAAKAIDWYSPPTAVFDPKAGVYGRWFVGATCNTCYNALDRHVAYCASKAAIVSMTEVLAIEWARAGINVNAISPTVVETALGKKAWAGEVGEAMKQKIPVGRFAQPEEIASAALYLVSEHTRIMTGSNVVIDGGYTIQ